jgi:hypothetical protein
MARVVYQSGGPPDTVTARIQAAQQEALTARRETVRRELPHPLMLAIEPLAGWVGRLLTPGTVRQGRAGEQFLVQALRWRLDDSWIICPDIALGPKTSPARIDHLLIGQSGLFVLEAKKWSGVLQAHGNHWERRQGNSWVPVPSPTRENAAHCRKFRWWLRSLDLAAMQEAVHPAVVVLDAWLRVTAPPMPVFNRPGRLIRWLLTEDRSRPPLRPDVRRRLLEALDLGIPTTSSV